MDYFANKSKKALQLVQALFYEYKVRNQFNRVGLGNAPVSDVVISLTSYRDRFKKLSVTLKSLILQDTRASKILLWVSEEDKQRLPADVSALVDLGYIDVHVSENYGPGTKILPALKHFPEFDIVTADDDIYYPPQWLSELLASSKKYPGCVVAHRVHKVTFDNNGRVLNYDDWIQEATREGYNPDYFATGVGGVFYPSGCFVSEVLNMESYMANCRFQDDVWLFFMERLSGTKVCKSSFSYELIPWLSTKSIGLNVKNCHGENDKSIARMESQYGSISDLLNSKELDKKHD